MVWPHDFLCNAGRVEAAANAGVQSTSYTVLRLPHGVKDLFQSWLHEHFPGRAEKVLNRVCSMHDGCLYKAEFGSRIRSEGFYADQIERIFDLARKNYGLTTRTTLSTAAFRRDACAMQITLF